MAVFHQFFAKMNSLRRRPRPLLEAVRKTPAAYLAPGPRSHLLYADKCLHRGRTNEAIHYLEIGLCGCTRLPALRGLVWMMLGTAHVTVGDYQKGSICHLNHLATCRYLGNFSGIAKAECNLGITYTKQGLLKLAERCFLQYLDSSRKIQDKSGVSVALSNLGALMRMMGVQLYETEERKAAAKKVLRGYLERAVDYMEQHLLIEEYLHDLEKQVRAYGHLGWCHRTLKKYPQAIFCYTKQLELCRMVGDRLDETWTLCLLGNCLRATGEHQQALENYKLSYELSRASGYREEERVTLYNLGSTSKLLGQLDQAIEWYTLYLSAEVERGSLQDQAKALSSLAAIYEETHQMTKAEDHYRKLSLVFGELKEKEAQRIAQQCMQRVKVGAKEEKDTSIKLSRNTFKRFISSPRRLKTRTVSCSTVYRLPEPKKRPARLAKRSSWSFRLSWHMSTTPQPHNSLLPPVPEKHKATPCENEEKGGGDEQLGAPLNERSVDNENKSSDSCNQDPPQNATITEKTIDFQQTASNDGENLEKQDFVHQSRELPPPPMPSSSGSLTSFESVMDREEKEMFYHAPPSGVGLRGNDGDLRLSLSASEPNLFRQDNEWKKWLHFQGTASDITAFSQMLSSLNVDQYMDDRRESHFKYSLSTGTDSWYTHHASAPSLDHHC